MHGLDRPNGDRGANRLLSCSRNDEFLDFREERKKPWIQSTAKKCSFFSRRGSLTPYIRTHTAVQRRRQRAGGSGAGRVQQRPVSLSLWFLTLIPKTPDLTETQHHTTKVLSYGEIKSPQKSLITVLHFSNKNKQFYLKMRLLRSRTNMGYKTYLAAEQVILCF